MTAPFKIVNSPATPENAAVIFIDLMEGSLSTVHSMDQSELRRNVGSFAECCAILQLPVVTARFPMPGVGGEILHEITTQLPQAVSIIHSRTNCWEAPDLVAAVEKTGRRNLLMSGIATDVGLALTAISAALSGYRVYAAVDLSGTFESRIEQIAWIRMSQAGVVLTCWSSFLGEVQGDYGRDPGPRIRQIIGNHMSAGNTPAPGDRHE